MRAVKNTFDWKILREKAEENRAAEHIYLEIFLSVLFFILLLITLAAFLFLSPLTVIPKSY